MAVAEKKKYTEADYQLLEEGAPYQLINGDLVMSPSQLLLHQLIIGKLHLLISNHLQQSKIGGLVVLSPMDVRFDEENIFQPDLLYILKYAKQNWRKTAFPARPISLLKSFPLPPLVMI